MGHHQLVLDFSEQRPDGCFLVSARQHSGREKTGLFKQPFSVKAFSEACKQATDVRSLRINYGRQLYEALFNGPLAEALALSLDNLPQGEILHIVLSFIAKSAQHAELSSLPWELLYRERDECHLAMQNQILITRHLEVDQNTVPAKPVRKLSVLAVVANPKNKAVTSFNADHFRQGLTEGLRRDYELNILKKPTLEALTEELGAKRYDILHFIGHGGHDGRDWGMCFETDEGELDFVKANDLRQLFGNFPSLRLINLVSCELAQAVCKRDELAGVAHSLIAAGAPAVIAMNFSIRVDAAETYTKAFYAGLHKTLSLEDSFHKARTTLYLRNREGIDFATPVMFLRTGATPLWLPLPQRKIFINSIYRDPETGIEASEREGARMVNLHEFFEPEPGMIKATRIPKPEGWKEVHQRLDALVQDGRKDEVIVFSGRAWLTVWFILGYKFRHPVSIEVGVLQANAATNKNELWRPNRKTPALPLLDPDWQGTFMGGEVVVVLDVTRKSMLEAVNNYRQKCPEIKYLPMVYLSIPERSRDAIEDEAMAQGYVNAFSEHLLNLKAVTRIHLFMAMPQAMAFMLAHELGVSGEYVVYDYVNPSYVKTVTLKG